MGREIRRVPPNWQHPTEMELKDPDCGTRIRADGSPAYHPVHDENYTDRADRWVADCLLWKEGKHPDQLRDPELARSDSPDLYPYFWDWDGGPPDRNYYRHGKWVFSPEQATHYQIYENVTEGTPVSPVFASLEEMTEWLVGNGTPREKAEAFAREGYVFSALVRINPKGGMEVVERAGGLVTEWKEDRR